MSDETLPDSQRRIVEAAAEAFAEQGYHATATKDIARRAGVAEGTIFRYYPSKKALLIGAVGPLFLRALTPLVRGQLEAIFSTDYPDFQSFVRALATERLAFAQSHPLLLKLVLQEIPFHPELREQFRSTVFAAVFPLATGAVTRFQERGIIRAGPPATVVRLLISVIGGYILARVVLAPQDQWSDAEEIEAMAVFLAKGLAP